MLLTLSGGGVCWVGREWVIYCAWLCCQVLIWPVQQCRGLWWWQPCQWCESSVSGLGACPWWTFSFSTVMPSTFKNSRADACSTKFEITLWDNLEISLSDNPDAINPLIYIFGQNPVYFCKNIEPWRYQPFEVTLWDNLEIRLSDNTIRDVKLSLQISTHKNHSCLPLSRTHVLTRVRPTLR